MTLTVRTQEGAAWHGRARPVAPLIQRPITLALMIGSRGFFSPAPCLAAREEALAKFERLGLP